MPEIYYQLPVFLSRSYIGRVALTCVYFEFSHDVNISLKCNGEAFKKLQNHTYIFSVISELLLQDISFPGTKFVVCSRKFERKIHIQNILLRSLIRQVKSGSLRIDKSG